MSLKTNIAIPDPTNGKLYFQALAVENEQVVVYINHNLTEVKTGYLEQSVDGVGGWAKTDGSDFSIPANDDDFHLNINGLKPGLYFRVVLAAEKADINKIKILL